MINPNSDSESIASTAMERVGARQKSKHGTSGRFATFIWRRENNPRQECKRNDSANDTKDMEHRLKGPSSSKVSFDFFKNIRKHLQIKNLCKSKQKSKETDVSPSSNQSNIIPVIEPFNSCQEREASNNDQEISSIRQPLYENRLGDVLENSCHTGENIDNSNTQYYNSATGMNFLIVPTRQQDELTHDTVYAMPSCSDAITAVPSAIGKVPCNMNETLSNEHKVKASLAEELLNLSKYGWYWGPISGDEADTKLISEPDGAFLVRDSSDDRYVLTLSFKSSGKMLHARMEHSGGLFSLCNQCTESEGFTSVAALINHSMNFSQSAVICYSRPKYPGYPSFPVRLTKPVSRFTQVRSLQYLCRFVIRQNTRRDNIHKLPLPQTIKGYIQEAHY
ncbi:Suppressor of cytokine signaling 6 [Camponotus floridanus]|uniref:Suppressor of cytokine signaling 6 n=1 Tax=Camponotus floridanus TaxID=104421 RepID=E1ZWN8_CAMFO|nr:uncharacterized protein LOC105251179 [Camponotus floridanus]EFN74396.1 Suppressor of cytokine signaling 6 [Camponotus floridanus]